MHFDTANVDDAQAVLGHEAHHRGDAEVAQVLVIDGVVREPLEEVDEVREFDHEHAAWHQ